MPVNTTSMLNSLLHWKLSLFSSALFSDNSYLEKKWLNPEFAKWINFVQIKERVPKMKYVSPTSLICDKHNELKKSRGEKNQLYLI